MPPQRAPAVVIPRRQLSWITTERPEFVGAVPYVANTVQVMPTQGGILPSDKFYYGLRLEVRGRITMPGANPPAAVLADAPWSLIEKIHIEGYHRPRAAQEPFFDVRGADVREFFSQTQGIFSTYWASVNAALVAPVLPRTANQGIGIVAADTTDFIMYYDIVFPPAWPLPSPGVNRQQAQWLLDAPNYDRLVMSIQWGDQLSLFPAAVGVPTLTAYQSAVGVPDCRVQAIYALGGKNNLFQGFVPGRTWRYFAENSTGDILATVVNSRQYNVPRGFKISRIMVKTGVKSAEVTAGNNAYLTLLNTILTNIRLNYGTNKIVRWHQDFYTLMEAQRASLPLLASDGFGTMDFLAHGMHGEALNCQALVAGPTGDVDVFITADTAAGACQAALYLVEEMRGAPQFVG